MVTSNSACASGGSTDQLGVSVAQVHPRQYTADFRDAGNAVIPAPTVVEDTSQAYRVRITRTAGTDDLQHIAIALPACFTNITGVSTTDSGPPAYTAELTDNMFRLVPDIKLAANGQWVQVHFTATADCPTGAHEFRTASWKNTSPETGQGDIFQLSPGTNHPTLTVLSANIAPTVAATNSTVTVNEGQTAANSGVWGDANLTDTVTLSASVGTVNKSGTNAAGTWSWSYPTTDGPAQTQVVTITASDGTASTSTTFQLNVDNVAPSAIFGAPSAVNEASSIGLSLTSPSDPSSVDTAAGFEYAFDCGDGSGYGAFGASNTASCPTSDDGSRTVGGKTRDKDGGISEYTANVAVGNAAPTATVMSPMSGVTYTVGQTVVVYVSFKDVGKMDSHFCSANWNDSTVNSTVTASEAIGSGSGTCTLTHVYSVANANPGYLITVTVNDKDGGSVNTTLRVFVAAAKGGGKTTTPKPLTASSASSVTTSPDWLTTEQLAAVVAEAQQLWIESGRLDKKAREALAGAEVFIGDLPDLFLGMTLGTVITIDVDGAGWGWSLESGMDLVTVVAHELGHAAGLEHEQEGVMEEFLSPGEVDLPSARESVQSTSGGSLHVQLGSIDAATPDSASMITGPRAPAIRSSGRPSDAREAGLAPQVTLRLPRVTPIARRAKARASLWIVASQARNPRTRPQSG
jgi:hypothetical protein